MKVAFLVLKDFLQNDFVITRFYAFIFRFRNFEEQWSFMDE